MSVPSLSALFDILEIKRTELLGDAKSTIAAFFKQPDRPPEDSFPLDDDESQAVDWWQHYGFISRPKADTESLLLRFGANVFAIASRTLAAAGIYGQMADGDVAIYSLGKNVLRLNADGSVSLVKVTSSGKMVVITLTKNDEIKVMIPDGPWLEMSRANGVTINAGNAPLTLASGVSVQIIAPQLNNNVGFNKLHLAASKPVADSTANPIPNVFG